MLPGHICAPFRDSNPKGPHGAQSVERLCQHGTQGAVGPVAGAGGVAARGIPLPQSMERAARIHNAICSTKSYSIYCSLTGWTAPPPPASRKKYAISVRTSDSCWKTRLGGARQLGFCRARTAVCPAERGSGAEMTYFFQRAALALNGKAGRSASPSLCVLRVGPKLQ